MIPTISTKLKALNITAAFRKIGFANITEEKLKSAFESQKTYYYELPGTKMLLLPNEDKEIILEPRRLLVNDGSGKSLKESNICEYFTTTYKAIIKSEKLIAYGFNYALEIKAKKKVNFNNLLNTMFKKNLIKSGSITKAEFRLNYKKSPKRIYGLTILPSESEKKFIVTFNAHMDAEEINFEKLKKELNTVFQEVCRVVDLLDKTLF